MSIWTHINGVIEAETFASTNAQALYIVQSVVDHLPKITGSEGNADYFVNLENGYTTSTYAGGRCISKTQSHVLITIHGDLRDRAFEGTLRETTKALARLSKRLFVLSCVVCVESGYSDQNFIFNNKSWLIMQKDSDWVDKHLFRYTNLDDK